MIPEFFFFFFRVVGTSLSRRYYITMERGFYPPSLVLLATKSVALNLFLVVSVVTPNHHPLPRHTNIYKIKIIIVP